MTDIIKQQSGF